MLTWDYIKVIIRVIFMHKLNKTKEHRASRTYLGLGLITAPVVVSGAVLSSAPLTQRE